MIKTGKRILCLLMALLVMLSIPDAMVSAKSESNTVEALSNVIDGVLTYEQDQAKASSIQELLDSGLVQSAGYSNSDWLVIGISRYKSGLDYSKYISALDTFIEGSNKLKATDLQRIALVYSSVDRNETYIKQTVKASVGKLGVMSYIYGLILLDSRDYRVGSFPREDILRELMKLQLKDGGWALNGKFSDVDITAMALQALAPYASDKDIKTSVDKAIAFLSKRQEKTGDYQSFGTRCCESTAQVLTALAALDIDYRTDRRFIKNGNTLFDGLLLYRQADGGFSHTIDTKSDRTASVQAMYSLIAAFRQQKGFGSFYNFSATDKLNNLTQGLSIVKPENQAKSLITDENNKDGSATAGRAGAVKDSVSKGVIGLSGQDVTPSAAASGTLAPDISNVKQSDASVGMTNDGRSDSSSENKALNHTVTPPPGQGNHKMHTSDSASTVTHKDQGRRMDYRGIVTIIILAAVLLLLGAFYATGRRSKRKYLTVVAVAGVVLAAVWGLRFQSVEDYYRTNSDQVKANSSTVWLSIRCDTIAGQDKNIPIDGNILARKKLPLRNGDSVLDVLVRATKKYKIPLDYTGSTTSSVSAAYVNGIHDIYEQDFGTQSGWLYRVNGDSPGISCGDYKVKNGDKIEWVYTCDLGKDVGRE